MATALTAYSYYLKLINLFKKAYKLLLDRYKYGYVHCAVHKVHVHAKCNTSNFVS